MKCPHCLTSFHDNLETTHLGSDNCSAFEIHRRSCPNADDTSLVCMRVTTSTPFMVGDMAMLNTEKFCFTQKR